MNHSRVEARREWFFSACGKGKDALERAAYQKGKLVGMLEDGIKDLPRDKKTGGDIIDRTDYVYVFEDELDPLFCYIFNMTAWTNSSKSQHAMGKILTTLEASGLTGIQLESIKSLIRTFFKQMRQDIVNDLYDFYITHIVDSDSSLVADLEIVETIQKEANF